MKTLCLFLARAFALAIILVLVTNIVNMGEILILVRSVPMLLYAVLVFFAVFRIWLTGLRWQIINPDPDKQLSWWDYFRLVMIAGLFNLVMPGALGGDIVRATMTIKTIDSHRTDNLIGIVVDRFIGLSSIIVLGVLSLFWVSDNIEDQSSLYGLFGALVLAFAIVAISASSTAFMRLLEWAFLKTGSAGRALLRLLAAWRNALRYFRSNPQRVLWALVLCLPIHGISFVSFYLIALQFGMPLSIFDISAVLALVWVITAVPVTIAGAGVRELTLIYLLGLYGVSPESATALSLFTYAIALSLAIIGVVFWFIGGSADTHA